MKISEIITEFQNSIDYKWFKWGTDYYSSNNTEIMSRRKEYWHTNRGLSCDPYKANHKLPSGFFKKIVDQKIQYLLGNGLESEYKDELNGLTGDIDKHLIDIGTIAAKYHIALGCLILNPLHNNCLAPSFPSYLYIIIKPAIVGPNIPIVAIPFQRSSVSWDAFIIPREINNDGSIINHVIA